MSKHTLIKCTNCHHQTDAPDKIQHFVDLHVLMYTNFKEETRLCLDFCSEGCRDDFIRDHIKL